MFFQELYYDCNGDCLNDSNANGVCDEIEPTISVNTDTLFYSAFVGETLIDSIEVCNIGQGDLIQFTDFSSRLSDSEFTTTDSIERRIQVESPINRR